MFKVRMGVDYASSAIDVVSCAVICVVVAVVAADAVVWLVICVCVCVRVCVHVSLSVVWVCGDGLWATTHTKGTR